MMSNLQHRRRYDWSTPSSSIGGSSTSNSNNKRPMKNNNKRQRSGTLLYILVSVSALMIILPYFGMITRHLLPVDVGLNETNTDARWKGKKSHAQEKNVATSRNKGLPLVLADLSMDHDGLLPVPDTNQEQNKWSGLDIEFRKLSKGSKTFQSIFSQPVFSQEVLMQRLDADLGVVVGGYEDGFSSATRRVQFFNYTTKSWILERSFVLGGEDSGIGNSHQGFAFDPATRWLYILGGQIGGGCPAAVAKAVQVHVETQQVQEIAPLPVPVYSPHAVLVKEGNILYLYATGGVNHLRNLTSVYHWRLAVSDENSATAALAPTTQWEELEPVSDSGMHGIAFYHEGYIYHLVYCYLDNGVFISRSRLQEAAYPSSSKGRNVSFCNKQRPARYPCCSCDWTLGKDARHALPVVSGVHGKSGWSRDRLCGAIINRTNLTRIHATSGRCCTGI